MSLDLELIKLRMLDFSTLRRPKDFYLLTNASRQDGLAIIFWLLIEGDHCRDNDSPQRCIQRLHATLHPTVYGKGCNSTKGRHSSYSEKKAKCLHQTALRVRDPRLYPRSDLRERGRKEEEMPIHWRRRQKYIQMSLVKQC